MTAPTSASTPPAPRLLRRSATVAAGTLTSRLTGLVRVGVTAAVLGDTLLADTYNRANTAPNIVYELLLGGVLTASLLPIFVSADEDSDNTAIAAVFTAAMAFLVAITFVAILAAPLIASFFTGRVPTGARDEAAHVATLLVRLFMPQIIFYGFTALATAALNARRRFVAAAFAPVLNNIVVIAVLLLVRDQLPDCPHQGSKSCTLAYASGHTSFTVWLGVGTTLGIAAMAIALVVPLLRMGTPLIAGPGAFRHPAVRRMVKLSGWTLGYVVSNQLALAFVVWLSGNRAGTFTQYQNAFIFFQLPHGLLAVSIMTAVVPEFATSVKHDDYARLREQFVTGFRYLLIAMVPAAGAYVALAPSIVNLLGHGAFGPDAVWATSRALTGFAVGLVPFSVYLYCLRVFYAQGDTRTPFIINAAENLCNIALAAALYPHFGVGGLALAYSLSYFLAALGAIALLRGSIGAFPFQPLLRLGTKVLVAAGLGSTAAWLLVRDDYRRLGLAIVAGTFALALYLGFARLLGVEELSGISEVVRRRRRPRV